MFGEFNLEISLATLTIIVLAEAHLVYLHGTATVKGVMGAASVLDEGHHLPGTNGPHS